MIVKERPLLLDALYTLCRMGFKSSEISIVINEENRSAICHAIGDSAINLVIQEKLTGPATAVKAAYDSNPKLDELLIVQADDASWFEPIARDFALFHDRRHPIASMALLATGDPSVHFSTYNVNSAGMITSYGQGIPDYKHPGQGCNAGIYIAYRNSFMVAYNAVGAPHSNDAGLPAIINHMIDNELPVAGQVYEIPWKSANTTMELEVARAVSHSARSTVESATFGRV